MMNIGFITMPELPEANQEAADAHLAALNAEQRQKIIQLLREHYQNTTRIRALVDERDALKDLCEMRLALVADITQKNASLTT